MVGNPQARAENGELIHPMFDDTHKKFLQLLNEFYEAGVLAPDYFIIEWSRPTYTLNDKIGMLWYPAGSLLDEYIDGDERTSMIFMFEILEQPPIEGGKWYLWKSRIYMGFSKRGFTDGDEINYGSQKSSTCWIPW